MKMWVAFLLFSLVSLNSFAQSEVEVPPYKRFPTLPPLQLLLSDSTAKFTKNEFPKKKAVFFLLFSPDCSHCQHTAEELLKYKNDFKNIQIVMATLSPLWQMNEFIEKYKLKEIPGVVVGKDYNYIMPSFYAIKSLPFMAFYDKKGDLISTYEGSLDISRVLAIFKEHS
ncbi:MAG: thioredoxin [Chitinophagaceae bacterium]